MSNNCLVASKLEQPSTINHQIFDVLYIEDYLRVASVVDARKLTDKVFLHNTNFIADYDYEGYKITWSWFSDIFQFCTNSTYGSIFDKCWSHLGCHLDLKSEPSLQNTHFK